MERGVIGEHHGGQIVLPVQRGLIDVRRQVLGNGFVGYLCLTVTLRVVSRGGGVVDFQQLKKIFCEFGTEFFPLICDNFQRDPKSANPPFKNGRGNCERFFVGNGHHFCILGEGVSHAENVLFPCFGFQWTEQVSVHPLLWLGALRQWCEQHGWFSVVSSSPDLATVALLQVFLDVGIHSGPVVALGDSFPSFGDAVVSGKHGPVGVG